MAQRLPSTPAEINKMTDRELVGVLDAATGKRCYDAAKMSFAKPPEKRPDESTGQYRQRKREAAKVDDAELAISVRRNLRLAVYEKQAGQRVIDTMTGAIDPEESAVVRQRIEHQEEQHRQADREGGRDFGMAYGPAAWDGAPAAKPLPPAAAAKPNPTRPAPRRSKGKK